MAISDNLKREKVEFIRPHITAKRRVRVYYHLETAGEEYLKQRKREYISHTAGVLRILGVKDIDGTMEWYFPNWENMTEM